MKKILYSIVATVISAFFGLFILPLDVETHRWEQIDVPREVLWVQISDLDKWNSWQPWADANQADVIWDGGKVLITTLDQEQWV